MIDFLKIKNEHKKTTKKFENERHNHSDGLFKVVVVDVLM
jgi:hypothetical protein